MGKLRHRDTNLNSQKETEPRFGSRHAPNFHPLLNIVKYLGQELGMQSPSMASELVCLWSTFSVAAVLENKVLL